MDIKQNENGEQMVFCRYSDKWMNVNKGECLGNCKDQYDPEVKEKGYKGWEMSNVI